MKKMLTVIVIGILCVSMLSIITPGAKALANETSLEVAEKAATWTISQAISENGGYKWAVYLQSPYYAASLQYGSAGFGILYLELYKKTQNSMYLDYAKGAAQWIISQAVPDSGGYKWPHFDDSNPSPGWWLSPAVSGIGEFLLQIYQTTGNSLYLDYAKGAAQWLMAMAYYGEPGCFIPYNPPNPYGTQAAHGIDPAREAYTVTFLLHLYEETGNTAYLPYVEGTAEWLISGPDKIQTPNGYEWRFNRPYYSDYPPDGEGRIALFFYEIYEALGDPTYLQYAQGTMNWLLSQATVNGDTAKWFDPGIGSCRTLPFSGSGMGGVWGFWGVPEPNELLMRVYDITKNPTYLDYARKLANWIISPAIAVPEGGGYKFPDSEGGSVYNAYQNARIYNFLSWLYSVTGKTSYRDYADGALQWIIFTATESDGGYEWITMPWFPYYATWFEPGAAGIGYYLASSTHVPTKWAVILGDNEYTDRSNPVKGAVNSANDMYDLVINKFGFPATNVHLRTDTIGNSADDIKTSDVKSELDWLAGKVQPGDTAIFYYAGHGSETNGHEYIVPHDQIGIVDSDFVTYVSKIQTSKLLIILDMSYSGGFITDGQTWWQGLLGIIPSWTDLASGTPSGRIVLTACGENVGPHLLRDAKWQLFWHYNTGWRYEMVFTHYFTMGYLGGADSNGDGKVTIEEAFKFAQSRAVYTQTPLMYDGYPAHGSPGDLYLG